MNAKANTAALNLTEPTVKPSPGNIITLTEEQLAHYEEGDGVFIKSPAGETVSFIVYDTLDEQPPFNHTADNAKEVKYGLAALEGLIVNSTGYLELNEEASQGLALILGEMHGRL